MPGEHHLGAAFPASTGPPRERGGMLRERRHACPHQRRFNGAMVFFFS
jgi:hypothetical protein